MGDNEKKSVDPINLKKLSVLTNYRQNMVLAEKINEIITLINKFKLV
jgi:hypothetical protein